MFYKELITLIILITFITNPSFADNGDFNDNNLIQLDGSGSQDADGDKLIYSWRQVSGPMINLIQSQTARPSFYAEEAGEYAFELVVSDGRVKSAPAIVNVVIEEANEVPIAILPEKISIVLGATAILDASNSKDLDQDSLLYNFRQISGPSELLRSTVSREPKISLKPNAIGKYSFELIVNDGRANSKPALCVIEVARPNTAPIARVTAPQKKVIRSKHRFNKSISIQAKPGIKQQVTIPRISPAEIIEPKAKIDKTHKAKISLIKTENLPDMIEEINSLDTNQPLNIAPIASTSGDMEVTPGTKVVLKGFGVDPDGDALQFIWNQASGPMIPGSPIMRKNLAFIPRKEGTYVFELVVSDGNIKSDPASCAVTVSKRDTEDEMLTLNTPEFEEDLDALELSIPKENAPVHANAKKIATDESDISFRELFSID